MKLIAVWLCCFGTMSVLAGLRFPGPVYVVDGVGMCRYDYVELHNIIGEVDAIEIIGSRDGVRESRGYVRSASPDWVLPMTNGVQRPYRLLADDKFDFKSCSGIGVSLSKCSLDGDRLLTVISNRVSPIKQGGADGLHGEVAYAKAIVDGASGLVCRSSEAAEFDDGSGVSAMVSFYDNGQGQVKVWYEVVDSVKAIIGKGWVSGRIVGSRLLDKSESSLHGEKKIEVTLNPREVKNTLQSFERRDIVWLHVAIKYGDAIASVGNMIKRECTNGY